MRSVEKNLSKHDNGTFYFVARRNRRLHVLSLKTKDIEVARSQLRALGIDGLIRRALASALPPAAGSGVLGAPPTAGAVINAVPASPSVVVAVPSVAEAVDIHFAEMALNTKGSKEMAVRGAKVTKQFATTWKTFSPSGIWNAYKVSRVESLGRELGSALNHLVWYFGYLVPWCISRGYLDGRAMESLETIPRVLVNPRRMYNVPSPEQVNELLLMVATESQEGSEFLRLLATTGLRRGGALSLTWGRVNLKTREMSVLQRHGNVKVIPFTAEALELLMHRRMKPTVKVFDLDMNQVECLERLLKKYAKGLGLHELDTFHSFRHFFASRALMAGVTVPEVAKLLGHSDGGQLVLRNYSHICDQHLKSSIVNLRLTS